MRKKYLSLTFSILFLIAGIVFLFLYGMNYISDFVPLSMGSSMLEYLPIFFVLSISSFAAFALLFVLFFAEYKIIMAKPLYFSAFAIIMAAFIIVNSVNAAGIIGTYRDNSYYYDEDLKDEFPESYNKERHIAAVNKYFPYFSEITDVSDGIEPYYSYTNYSFDGTSYTATQIFSQLLPENGTESEYLVDITFTAEYFTTDKSYLMGKYIAEQSTLFATDENAKALPENAVKQENKNGRDFLIYSSDTYKVFCMADKNGYYSVCFKDGNNDLKLSKDDFINYCFEQYQTLKSDSVL